MCGAIVVRKNNRSALVFFLKSLQPTSWHLIPVATTVEETKMAQLIPQELKPYLDHVLEIRLCTVHADCAERLPMYLP